MKERQSNRRNRHWVLIALLTAFAAFAGAYGGYQLPPLQDMVQVEIGLSASQYSKAFSAAMLPGVFFSLIAGALIDRFGFRRMIALSLVISTTAAAGRILCKRYFPFYAAMALTGMAPTFVQSNHAKIMSNYVAPEKLSFAIGLVMMGACTSSFIASSTTHLFPTTASAYLFSGILGIAALVLWLFGIRPSGKQAGSGTKQTVSIGSALKNVLRSANVWRVGLCMFFVEGFFMSVSSTGPSALKAQGYTAGAAGLLAGIQPIGFLLGCLFGGTLAVKTGRPKLCMLLLSALTAAQFPLLWASRYYVLCAVAFFLCGFCLGTGLIAVASMPIFFPEIGKDYAGTAGGLINTLEMSGGVIIPSFIIAPIAGSNYRLQFLLTTGSLCLGFLSMFLIPKIDMTGKS